MSILVTEKWSGPKLTISSSAYRAARVFDVTGVLTQSQAVAAVAAFDPSTAYNAKHPNSIWMYVDSQDAVNTGLAFWTVTITYSSTPAGRHVDPGNPLNEPIQYAFQWSLTTQGTDRDYFGNVIQNSAGQSFSSLTPTDVLNGTMIAVRNEPFYDAYKAVTYSNAINSAPVSFGPAGVWNLDKGQARCLDSHCSPSRPNPHPRAHMPRLSTA